MRTSTSFLGIGTLCVLFVSLTRAQVPPFNCFAQFAAATQVPDPDQGLTTDQIITKYGYPVETIKVHTADGYILTKFRIPYSPLSPLIPGQRKKAVYLAHGILSDSASFVIQYKARNLAMLLADSGFDVFIGNARGSPYSQEHETLSIDSTAFWNFSWHEMGIYDEPAVIDMILAKTGNSQLYYVGHSMGTTRFMVMLSQKPEYNAKIATAFLFTPVAYLSHATSPLHAVSLPLALAQPAFNLANHGKFDVLAQITDATGISLGGLCTISAINCGACGNAMFFLFGFDEAQMNYTALPHALDSAPVTTSTKAIVHYAQNMNSGTFSQFDYGWVKNLVKYGSVTPPTYNLGSITAPTVFWWSDNDNLATPTDVAITASKFLPSTLKENNRVNLAAFNHLDFAIAIDADTLVYNYVRDTMVAARYG